MELIAKLKQSGFVLDFNGEKIRLEYSAGDEPPEECKVLLDSLREFREEAIAYLKIVTPQPYFGQDGDVVIPFGSDSRYHWWNGGQSIAETTNKLMEAIDA